MVTSKAEIITFYPENRNCMHYLHLCRLCEWRLIYIGDIVHVTILRCYRYEKELDCALKAGYTVIYIACLTYNTGSSCDHNVLHKIDMLNEQYLQQKIINACISIKDDYNAPGKFVDFSVWRKKINHELKPTVHVDFSVYWHITDELNAVSTRLSSESGNANSCRSM